MIKSSLLIWRYAVNVKLTVKILSIFVAFFEDMNFNKNYEFRNNWKYEINFFHRTKSKVNQGVGVLCKTFLCTWSIKSTTLSTLICMNACVCVILLCKTKLTTHTRYVRTYFKLSKEMLLKQEFGLGQFRGSIFNFLANLLLLNSYFFINHQRYVKAWILWKLMYWYSNLRNISIFHFCNGFMLMDFFVQLFNNKYFLLILSKKKWSIHIWQDNRGPYRFFPNTLMQKRCIV